MGGLKLWRNCPERSNFSYQTTIAQFILNSSPSRSTKPHKIVFQMHKKILELELDEILLKDRSLPVLFPITITNS